MRAFGLDKLYFWVFWYKLDLDIPSNFAVLAIFQLLFSNVVLIRLCSLSESVTNCGLQGAPAKGAGEDLEPMDAGRSQPRGPAPPQSR